MPQHGLGKDPSLDRIFDFAHPFPIAQPVRKFGEDRVYNSSWQHLDRWLHAALNFQVNGTAAQRRHSRYLVNLGAHYQAGIDDIVSYSMQSNDIEGFAVDDDQTMAWAGSRIRKHTGYVTPTNIAELFRVAHVPPAPLLLKVDIDSYDVDVAMAALELISPVFIFVEINEKVPPPMCFCNRFTIGKAWKRVSSHGYGCSLTGFVNAFRQKEYQLVSVILNDALFVRSDQAQAVAAQLPHGRLPKPHNAYASGFVHMPHRAQLFPWNEPVKNWFDETIPLATRSKSVHEYFKASEAGGYIYPFVGRAKHGTWPCASAATEAEIEASSEVVA